MNMLASHGPSDWSVQWAMIFDPVPWLYIKIKIEFEYQVTTEPRFFFSS